VPVGPARLALACGSPVVVGTLEPAERGRFRLRIEPVQACLDELELTRRVMSLLTERILGAPEHWLWMARPLARPGAKLPAA
jgi:lauroyl/myristoyl acyltransferase